MLKPYKELTVEEIKKLTPAEIDAYGETVKGLMIQKIHNDIERLKQLENDLNG